MIRNSPYSHALRGLVGIRSAGNLSPYFILGDVVNSLLRENTVVIFTSYSTSKNFFRVACNKASLPANQENLRFISPQFCEFDLSISEKLIKSLYEEIKRLGGKKCLVILDNMTLICGPEEKTQIKLIHKVFSLLSEESSLIYTRSEQKNLTFDHDAVISLMPVGSTFGKKVTGMMDVQSLDSEKSVVQKKRWHYCTGERSIQFFHHGDVDVL